MAWPPCRDRVETGMGRFGKAILISIGLTVLLNAILWMSGCSVIQIPA